ncbi:hypothetical protein [Streptomyces sp. KN37]|uniref:hypothetical protein n=1 Tax=Streptomyces sp. KN37 TaxID=3090667 RepID=UPI002A7487E8|nr:hypothetical protein [Streptomyces sp. KN37]WPO76216.1 hypothetical protein R9806_36665 [Streptomyces sp. KN37]
MSTVDALLAQSLLLPHPHVPSDVVGYDDLGYAGLTEDFLLRDGEGSQPADDRAAQNLTALCEAVVARCTIEQLADFLTDQVPQPEAAWILGCALQLADADDGARFWWQYAAGAGDAPASYCLYLQHLAHGDTHAAALWQDQASFHAPRQGDAADTGEQAPARQVMTADTSLSTLLRVLSRLSRTVPRTHTQAAQAVIEFVAASVSAGYHRNPDLELPLPGSHFVEQLVILAASLADRPGTTETGPAEDLPNRNGCGTDHLPVPGRGADPERLLVKVTADEHEGASAQVFFKEAVAVCWEKATAAGNPSARGSAMAYYLKRFRTRAALALTPAPSGRTPKHHSVAVPQPAVGYSRS